MEDYKLIFEAYQKVNEAQFSMWGNYNDSSEQPKKQLAKFKHPKRDNKNSTSFTTAPLPGGTRSINIAAMGTGGGIAENEEVEVKGYGKMTKKQIRELHSKVKKQAEELKRKNNTSQLKPKLELLKTLANHL